jgi:hypothetical protein
MLHTLNCPTSASLGVIPAGVASFGMLCQISCRRHHRGTSHLLRQKQRFDYPW